MDWGQIGSQDFLLVAYGQWVVGATVEALDRVKLKGSDPQKKKGDMYQLGWP